MITSGKIYLRKSISINSNFKRKASTLCNGEKCQILKESIRSIKMQLQQHIESSDKGIRKMEVEIAKMKQLVIESNRRLLEHKGSLNVRGGLQHCIGMITGDTHMKFPESAYSIYRKLNQDDEFLRHLQSTLSPSYTLRLEELMNKIWIQVATTSESQSESTIIIDSKDFQEDEAKILMTLFEYFQLPYKYNTITRTSNSNR